MSSLSLAIPRVAPSLNTLLNWHWATRKKEKEIWIKEIQYAMSQQPAFIPRKPLIKRCKIAFTRYSVRQLDRDNLAGSFKVIGDALKRAGVIEDDSPEHVIELVANQGKVRRFKDQRTEIIIIEEL